MNVIEVGQGTGTSDIKTFLLILNIVIYFTWFQFPCFKFFYFYSSHLYDILLEVTVQTGGLPRPTAVCRCL
jgi:hypothetical protein